MAQLKDTLVSGSLRATDTIYTTKLQTGILYAPTSSSGTAYGPGSANNILLSNGSSIYWGTIGDVEVIKLKGINNSGVAAVGSANRPTTANLNYTDGSVRYFLATSAMESSSKPTMGDSHVLHLAWDNTAYAAQLAVEHIKSGTSYVHAQIRGQGSTQANWSNWFYLLDENNYTDYTVTKTGTGASGNWGISITGNADTATKATQDESGNNIKTNYASSLFISGTTFTLKSKSDASLSEVALTSVNIPNLNASKITDGILPVARGGTGETSFSAGYLLYTPTTGSIKSTKFMHLNYKAGTTSTLGYEELILGNTNTEGTVDNAFGRIGFYSAKTKGSYITAADTTNSSWYDHVLPASAGWIVTGGSYDRTAGTATGVGSDTIPIYVSTAGRATAITKLDVAHGGTGTTSFTANSLIMSGTSTTAALTTRAISTSITTNASTNIPTESAVKTYVDNQIATIQGTVQGGYVTIAGNAQQVTGRKTLSNLAGASFKPAESSASCDISYNQGLGALVFSFTK